MVKVIKTEHVGAKNRGGYGGLRVDAKRISDKLRRQSDTDTLAHGRELIEREPDAPNLNRAVVTDVALKVSGDGGN